MPTAESPAARRPARPKARPALRTYDEFARDAPAGTKEDLINGVVVPAMSASTPHERVFRFVFFLLTGYVSAKGLGEVLGSRTLVRIDDRNGYEPDVLFVAKARAGIVRERDLDGAPDVAVEIVSRSSRKADEQAKFAGYERAGVREYWLLDPERQTAALYRRGADGLFADVTPAPGEPFVSEAVAGFRLDPAVLGRDPLPSEFDVLRDLLG